MSPLQLPADPPWLQVAGLRVLELGAGIGLCGVAAAAMGAQEVLITDYQVDVLKVIVACMSLLCCCVPHGFVFGGISRKSAFRPCRCCSCRDASVKHKSFVVDDRNSKDRMGAGWRPLSSSVYLVPASCPRARACFLCSPIACLALGRLLQGHRRACGSGPH